MHGKICLVTGASSGIGKATALALARAGATVVLVARDEARGRAAIDEIRRRTGSTSLELMLADLSSIRSTRALGERFRAAHDRLHVLVNCAGAIFKDRQLSPEGIELTFALDHLSYFLLTTSLLDVLQASSPARIVNVASEAHRPNWIDLDDVELRRRRDGYAGDLFRPTAYGQAKLANILFTYELARRLAGTGVTANCLHPGFVASRFGKNNPGLLTLLFTLLTPLRISPEKGAETVVYLATSPEVEGVTGKYFVKKKSVRSSRATYDEETARRLWDVCERMIAAHGG